MAGPGVKKKGTVAAGTAGVAGGVPRDVNGVGALQTQNPASASAGHTGDEPPIINGITDSKKAALSSSNAAPGKGGVGKLKLCVPNANGTASANKKDTGGGGGGGADAKVNGMINGAVGEGDHVMMSPDSLRA